MSVSTVSYVSVEKVENIGARPRAVKLTRCLLDRNRRHLPGPAPQPGGLAPAPAAAAAAAAATHRCCSAAPRTRARARTSSSARAARRGACACRRASSRATSSARSRPAAARPAAAAAAARARRARRRTVRSTTRSSRWASRTSPLFRGGVSHAWILALLHICDDVLPRISESRDMAGISLSSPRVGRVRTSGVRVRHSLIVGAPLASSRRNATVQHA